MQKVTEEDYMYMYQTMTYDFVIKFINRQIVHELTIWGRDESDEVIHLTKQINNTELSMYNNDDIQIILKNEWYPKLLDNSIVSESDYIKYKISDKKGFESMNMGYIYYRFIIEEYIEQLSLIVLRMYELPNMPSKVDMVRDIGGYIKLFYKYTFYNTNITIDSNIYYNNHKSKELELLYLNKDKFIGQAKEWLDNEINNFYLDLDISDLDKDNKMIIDMNNKISIDNEELEIFF